MDPTLPLPTTPDALRTTIAALLDEPSDDIGEDDNLLDHGLDSVRIMTLAQRWRDAGARFDLAELAAEPTLRHWWSVLTRAT